MVCKRFKSQSRCVIAGCLLGITHIKCNVIECNELSTIWLKKHFERVEKQKKTNRNKNNIKKKQLKSVAHLAYQLNWTRVTALLTFGPLSRNVVCEWENSIKYSVKIVRNKARLWQEIEMVFACQVELYAMTTRTTTKSRAKSSSISVKCHDSFFSVFDFVTTPAAPNKHHLR